MSKYYFLAIPIIAGIAVSGLFSVYMGDSTEDILLTAQKLTYDGSPILGDPSASITILEWGDYQCTFCYRFHQSSLKIIEEQYVNTGKAKMVFKDFPLNGPDSILAAEASYCAEDQGKYWQYHNELYTNWGGERTGWITRNSLNEFAITVKLDLDKFNTCLDENKYQQRVIELYEFGKEIGIDATPSFLIFNDKKILKITGNQPIDVFHQVIDEL